MIEYFAENLWQMWLLLSIILLVLELSSGDFFIMCFSIGAACATIAAALGLGFYGGLIVFAVCSVLCIFFVRPFALKYLHRNEEYRPSNADALMGAVGRVSENIEENGYGRVAIDGDDWKAVSASGEAIAVGEKVKVVGRESIIITVERV